MIKPLAVTTDSILIEVKGEEKEFNGTFHDGYAYLIGEDGKMYYMTYPKRDEITPKQKLAIEEYTGRDLEEYFEVALKYGKLAKNSAKAAIEDERQRAIMHMVSYIIERLRDKENTSIRIKENVEIEITLNDKTDKVVPFFVGQIGDDSFGVSGTLNGEEGVFKYSETASSYNNFEAAIINYIFDNIDDFCE